MRSLLSCICPCDHIGMIKLVHLNGHVQEFGTPVTVAQVIKAFPHHFVVQVSYVPPRVVHIQPDAQLQLGQIYFLLPLPKPHTSSPESLASVPLPSRRSADVCLSKRSHEENRTATISTVPWTVKKVYREQFSRLVNRLIEENEPMEKIKHRRQKRKDAEKNSAERRSARASSRCMNKTGSWRPALESIVELA